MTPTPSMPPTPSFWAALRDGWLCFCLGARQVMCRSSTYCRVCRRRRPRHMSPLQDDVLPGQLSLLKAVH